MSDSFHFSSRTRDVFSALVRYVRDECAEELSIDPYDCNVLDEKLLFGRELSEMDRLLISTAYQEFGDQIERLEKS